MKDKKTIEMLIYWRIFLRSVNILDRLRQLAIYITLLIHIAQDLMEESQEIKCALTTLMVYKSSLLFL